MQYDLELDLRELMTALHVRSLLQGKDVYDPFEKVITGASFQLLDSDVILHIQDLHLLRPTRSRLIRSDYATIQFTQTGSYKLYGDGQIRHVRSGSVRLNTIPETVSEFHQATSTLRAASIIVRCERLIEEFGLRADLLHHVHRTAFPEKERSSVSIEIPLTSEMWLILDSLIECQFEEPIRSLYLAAKTIELLCLAVAKFNTFDLPDGAANFGSSANEQQLIDIASLIYSRELNHPPSIEQLSRRVGMNRNKLTSGFRSTFGKTPAEYSRELRLNWAAQRLTEGMAIKQVAAEAGYGSVAAFGRAFRELFGHAPSAQEVND